MTENKMSIEIARYNDYVCRNKSGILVIFRFQTFVPTREGDRWVGNKWVNQCMTEIGMEVTDPDLLSKFGSLTWEDDPVNIKSYGIPSSR